MSLDLVVIDLDDTVYLEREYVRSGFLAVAELIEDRAGILGFSDLAWNLFLHGVRGDIFDRVLKQLKLTEEFDVQELVECYRHHDPDIAMAEDAIRFLDGLGKRVPLALITDGPPVSQRRKILALGLDRYLDETVVTYESGTSWHKPNPAAFLHVQAQFDAKASCCIYLADNPAKDFHAPRELGWLSLRIRRPGSLHFLEDSSVDEADAFPGKSWIDERV